MISNINYTHKLNSKSPHNQYFSEKDDNILAVLGPTNTGKTYYAIERMLSYKTGIIGCPLRLLAREIYEKLIKIQGYSNIALITGEESIIPPLARYYVCTVEAMPKNIIVEFAAIDEIQLATHHERGHIFTDRLLNYRGTLETLFLGSSSLSGLLRRIIPSIKIKNMKRFSSLKYIGKFKISKIPRRSAIVTFSVSDVYEIAEFVKRRHGGTAVVLGALSPKTRNAQVSLYESGEVDHLVATDAIGMGLNMDINHLAFAKLKKYDGKIIRNLSSSEAAQIAGRAGRYRNDGTFGETAGCSRFTEEMIKAIENHKFHDVHSLMWRNSNLDFSSTKNLFSSLILPSNKSYLVLNSESDDEKALRYLLNKTKIKMRTLDAESIKELWNVCCIPDYQKNYDDSHFSILETIFYYLTDSGQIPEDWVNSHLEYLDNMKGELDLLGIRLLNVRMWNFISNRSNWISNQSGIKERAKEIENKLSDALHLGLVDRFVGYKTSRMLKKLEETEDLYVEIKGDKVLIEGHHVGHLVNFNFVEIVSINYKDSKSTHKVIKKSLSEEIKRRVNQITYSSDKDFSMDKEFNICWNAKIIAFLRKGPSLLKPDIKIVHGNLLHDNQLKKVTKRVSLYLNKKISFQKVFTSNMLDVFPNGLVKGLIYQLSESSGCLLIADVKDILSDISQEEKNKLIQIGVKFGTICLWLPKTMTQERLRFSWVLSLLYNDKNQFTSFPITTKFHKVKKISKSVFNAGGFVVIGGYAYFVDFIERLAAHINIIINQRPSFLLTKKNINTIYKKFGTSPNQIESVLNYMGYIKKNNTTYFYVLKKTKLNAISINNKKLQLSPFRILYNR